MAPAMSLEDILKSIAYSSYGDSGWGEQPGPNDATVMVGILFAPPGAELADKELLPRLNYYHHRSGKNIDFFCAGYTKGWEGGEDAYGCGDYKKAGLEGWVYSNKRFDDLRNELSQVSKWKYSGQSDLILTNATYSAPNRTALIDFSSAIVCRLDEMKRDGAIGSASEFFEKIFEYAESADPNDPTWGFSDRQGLKEVGSSFARFVLSLIPSQVAESYKKAKHYAVADISRP